MADIVTIRLPRPLADRVDAARPSTLSREAFVRRAVEAALPGHEGAGDREAEEGRGVRHASAEPNRAPSSPAAPPRASDDVRRREPDPRMFKTAGDHRRAMARFNARGEW